jgi:hypothetical protein
MRGQAEEAFGVLLALECAEHASEVVCNSRSASIASERRISAGLRIAAVEGIPGEVLDAGSHEWARCVRSG